MNLIYGLLALVVISGAAYFQGRSDGRAVQESEEARDERVALVAREAAASAAATAISRIKVAHTTIRQETEREIRTNTVYADCRHGADQLRRINAALAGPAGGAPGDRELPASGAAR